MKKLLSFLPRLWTNWITLAGTALTTVTGCTLLLAVAADLVTPIAGPYTLAAMFLIMPMFFIFGLVLIPVGFLWERWRRKARPTDPVLQAFGTAMQDRRSRFKILFVGFLSLVNIVLIGAVGHRAIVWMDSPSFCGTLCHSVMQPEYEAYVRSPHSRVNCTSCHIGPGASWAVKSKLDGLRQVWALMTDSFHRPVPTPVKELRPARDTCEQCHWPARFHGSKVNLRTHYQSDEQNTAQVTALLVKIGGQDPKTGAYHGIHWHVSPEVELRYQPLDESREKIGKITWRKGDEVVAEFDPATPGTPVGEERIMDCVDCHNRPTHIYDQTPEDAVDQALVEGRLDGAVPFMRKVAVQVLSPNDLDRDAVEEHFQKEIARVYQAEHAGVTVTPEKIKDTAAALAALYRRNIYPELKIGWDTYPTHLGHRGGEQDRRGCFRCHDDEHKTKDGKTLSQDCDLCHEILSQDSSPDELPEVLQALTRTKP